VGVAEPLPALLVWQEEQRVGGRGGLGQASRHHPGPSSSNGGFLQPGIMQYYGNDLYAFLIRLQLNDLQNILSSMNIPAVSQGIARTWQWL
jgi:hypothetical protein